MGLERVVRGETLAALSADVDAVRLFFVSCRVRKLNLGGHFFALIVAFCWASVDKFGNFFGGLLTLSRVKSVASFC